VLVTGNTSGQGGTFAYDLATGKPLWSVPGHIRGGPLVAGGFAYAVNDTRERYRFALRKLDLRTGKAAWAAIEEDLGNHDGPPVLAGGTIVLASRNRTIAGYEAATGTQRWQHTRVDICTGRLSAAGEVVYFGGGLPGTGHTLTALDAASGTTKWSTLLAASDDKGCGASTAVADGVVVTGIGRSLVAYDAETGARRWALTVTRTTGGRREDLALTQMVVTGGVVYVASPTAVVGVDLSSGRQTFEMPLPVAADLGSVRLRAAADVLYLHARAQDGPPASRAATLYALDVAEKRVLWSHKVARAGQYDPGGTWPTQYVLPLDGGLIYENSQLLVRLK